MRIPPLTEVVGPIMNLINETHNLCEKREYAFNVLQEYSIITHNKVQALIKKIIINKKIEHSSGVNQDYRSLIPLYKPPTTSNIIATTTPNISI